MKLKQFIFHPKTQRIINFIIYTVFVIFSVNLILKTQDIKVKALYLAITLIMLSVAMFAEYLKYQYHLAIKALNMECDPENAVTIFNHLQKKDIFRSYKNDRILFDLLYYVATFDSERILKHLETYDKQFRSSIDMLFIRNVSTFQAYVYANNKTQAKKWYPEIVKLKDAKVKGHKIAPIYHYTELEALFYYMSNDYQKALKNYKLVNTAYMNNKELTQFYLYQYKTMLQIDSKQAEGIKKELYEVCNKLPVEKML